MSTVTIPHTRLALVWREATGSYEPATQDEIADEKVEKKFVFETTMSREEYDRWVELDDVAKNEHLGLNLFFWRRKSKGTR